MNDSQNTGQRALPEAQRRSDRIRTILLGLHAWLIAVGGPPGLMFATGEGTGEPLGLAPWTFVLPPLALAALVGAMGHPWESRLRDPIALFAFPLLLALAASLSLAAFPAADGPTTWYLALSALAFAAYLLSAAAMAGRPPAVRVSRERPMASTGAPSPNQRTPQRIFVGTVALAAFASLIVAASPHGAWIDRWGDAAPAARVLATLFAGALGTAVLAAIVGPSLRAERGRPTAALTNQRAVLWIAVALFACGFLIFYRLRS